jgi:transposase-like protein
VIVLAVRWYLRFGLSYRDVEELLAERGIQVDHVTVYRWVQRFTPLLAEAARPCRDAVGNRWHVDETYVKVAGRWRYLYRAIDQFGQIVDVLSPSSVTGGLPAASSSRSSARPISSLLRSLPTMRRCTRRCWRSCCRRHGIAPTYANNHIECVHGRLKARLRPIRGLKQDRSARVVIAGHGFMQNVRRGHYELAVEEPVARRLAVAFDEPALAI